MWIMLVLIISTICYLPMYLEQLGCAVPDIFIQLKYFFVLIPIIFSLIYIKKKRGIKKWLRGLFVQKVGAEPLVLCGVIAFCGVLCTYLSDGKTIDGISLIFHAFYLFCMAALEEIAWRGFRLESLLQRKTENIAIRIVSMEWAIWHVPMWMIRNAVGMNEIFFWLIYTALVGTILGKCMVRYQNILVPMILHTVFNVCFLMPIQKGVIVVFFVWLLYTAWDRFTHNGGVL